jgi:hypothetical protein
VSAAASSAGLSRTLVVTVLLVLGWLVVRPRAAIDPVREATFELDEPEE